MVSNPKQKNDTNGAVRSVLITKYYNKKLISNL